MFKGITIAQSFTFKKAEKLKSRKLIDILFKAGKSFSSHPLRVMYLPQQKSLPLQTGFAVSTKNFKKAVDRNRIKRLMREAYRLQKNELTEKLITNGKSMAVFFIYTGKEIPAYKEVSDKMHSSLNRLNKIADEIAAPGN